MRSPIPERLKRYPIFDKYEGGLGWWGGDGLTGERAKRVENNESNAKVKISRIIQI
jgi:hypothetical protein